MYCSQCGKEIPENSKFCQHCGALLKDIDINTTAKNNRMKSRKLFSIKTTLALVVAIIIVIIGISTCDITGTNDYEMMLERSRESIAPYLEYLPSKLNENSNIELDSEIYNNKNNVYFCGMMGTVSYHVNKYGNAVNELRWASNEFYTYEEEKALVDVLSDYFGKPAKVINEQYGQYNDTKYYWIDESVPCTVILYTSIRANHENEKDRIEIYWDMDEDIPN